MRHQSSALFDHRQLEQYEPLYLPLCSPALSCSLISATLSLHRMNPLDLVKLTALMERTSGRAEVVIGVLDGPVALNHPDLASENIRSMPGGLPVTCTQRDSVVCQHGTFVAGILASKRGTVAPAVCPDCTLLIRPIFKAATTAERMDAERDPWRSCHGNHCLC